MPDRPQVVASLPRIWSGWFRGPLQLPQALSDQAPGRAERPIVELRRRYQLGPARLAPRTGIPASTLHRVLVRHGVSRLSDLDRGSGRIIRRIETSYPGELNHVDIKKQAKRGASP